MSKFTALLKQLAKITKKKKMDSFNTKKLNTVCFWERHSSSALAL